MPTDRSASKGIEELRSGDQDRRLRPVALSSEVARFLVGLAAALLLTVPLLQPRAEVARALADLGAGAGAAARLRGGLFERNRSMRRAMEAFEETLEEGSWVVTSLRPPMRALLGRILETGDTDVQIGRGGWWFYRPAVTSLTGPGFLERASLAAAARQERPRTADPRPALRQLAADLAGRGIGLAVLSVPEKAAILPHHLVADVDQRALQNPSTEQLWQDLGRHAIDVLSVSAALAAVAGAGQEPYLRRDTHWSPDGLAAAVATVERWARGQELAGEDSVLRRRGVLVEGDGDLVVRLGLIGPWRIVPPQAVEVQRVETSGGDPWRAQRGSELLLLGDSYTNVYSQPELGWGASAGLAEQLSFALATPIDRIAINAGGALSSRRELARQLAEEPARLTGTRWVLLQVAARELAHGDWQPTPLPPPELATGE